MMKPNTARVFVALLLVFLSGRAEAVEWFVEAGVNPSTAETTDIVTYSVTVAPEGDTDASPRMPMPKFDGFIVKGRSENTQVLQLSTGVVRKATVFRFELRPIRTGTLRIPPSIVETGGQVLKTEPVEVEITASTGVSRPSSPQPQSPTARRSGPVPVKEPGDDFFVGVKAKKSEVYIGEPVFVRYDLYRLASFAPIWFDLREPDFVNFWSHDASDDNRHLPMGPVKRMANRDYQSELVAAYILVPMSSGTLPIAQTEVEVNRARGTVAKMWIASPKQDLIVKPLPSGAPDGFDAANVSDDLRLRADLLKSDGSSARVAQVGDSLTLSVRLSGDGAVSQMEFAPFEATDALQVFGPNNRERKDEVNRELLEGKQSMTYTVVPLEEGELEVPALRLVFFDPVKERYDTLEAGPWMVEVTGFAPNSASILEQVEAERREETTTPGERTPEAIAELRSAELGSGGRGTPLYESWWFMLLMAMPPLVLVGSRLWESGRERRSVRSSATRTRKALAVAEGALDDAAAGSRDAQIEAVDKAVRGYLESKVGAQRLSGERLVGALVDAGAKAKTARDVAGVLSELESRRFAPAGLMGDEGFDAVGRARACVRALEDELSA